MPSYTISIKSNDQYWLQQASLLRGLTLKELLKEQLEHCIADVRPRL